MTDDKMREKVAAAMWKALYPDDRWEDVDQSSTHGKICLKLVDAALAAIGITDETVVVPRDEARLIDQAFLPTNPNKMRSAAPEVVAAVKSFKDRIAAPPAAAQEGA